MIKLYSSLFFLLLIAASGYAQNPDDRKTYNSIYEVGRIPGLDSFLVFNKMERRYDSVMRETRREFDSLYGDKKDRNNEDLLSFDPPFITNRSRIYMDSDPTNRLFSGEDPSKPFSPSCWCELSKDSLFISMGVGLFGGIGFNIRLLESRFDAGFYIYTDDVKPYKRHLSDKEFEESVAVDFIYQYLVVDQRPPFKHGQQLTGFLTYTSDKFWERDNDSQTVPDSTYVTGQIHFTCTINKRRYEK
jgi:hypothetical protein